MIMGSDGSLRGGDALLGTWLTDMVYRLGIELAKTMSLNYSNQETSVTVGESVRDEDGWFSIVLLFDVHH
jgi:hypothetical protein